MKCEEYPVICYWITGIQDQKVQLNLLFDSKIHGFADTIFHERCDNKGPTITLYTNTLGYKFGGYTTLSWNKSIITYQKDEKAFIFSLNLKTKMT